MNRIPRHREPVWPVVALLIALAIGLPFLAHATRWL
jgi:hypothetical protein